MVDKRLRREAEFHDRRYSGEHESREGARKFYSIFAECRAAYLDRILEDVEDKRVLEYGCGPGGFASRLAKGGAQVVAIDISPEAIRQARKRTRKRLDVELLEMNAEAMDFPDEDFDMVCGTGILHHLDLARAFSELDRVLKPGGRALFIEPLGHNPAINAYRRRTPEMRSADEHPLLMSDFEMARSTFPNVDLTFFNLLTLLAVPVRTTKLFGPAVRVLGGGDRLLMRVAPFTKRYAWNVLIELSKATA
ncbi:MAG: class I SAM-dependent methyltransferase [bacterium]|nr:class I SAM-dependent methyltransferase [bacterium]